MPGSRATKPLKIKAIELHQQGLNPPQIAAALDQQVARNTVWKWVKDWEAEQGQQNAQISKEVA
jgi:hypothetical protein